MLFALAKSYLTYYFLPFTYYFPKNPAILGKREEVRGKKVKIPHFRAGFFVKRLRKRCFL